MSVNNVMGVNPLRIQQQEWREAPLRRDTIEKALSVGEEWLRCVRPKKGEFPAVFYLLGRIVHEGQNQDSRKALELVLKGLSHLDPDAKDFARQQICTIYGSAISETKEWIGRTLIDWLQLALGKKAGVDGFLADVREQYSDDIAKIVEQDLVNFPGHKDIELKLDGNDRKGEGVDGDDEPDEWFVGFQDQPHQDQPHDVELGGRDRRPSMQNLGLMHFENIVEVLAVDNGEPPCNPPNQQDNQPLDQGNGLDGVAPEDPEDPEDPENPVDLRQEDVGRQQEDPLREAPPPPVGIDEEQPDGSDVGSIYSSFDENLLAVDLNLPENREEEIQKKKLEIERRNQEIWSNFLQSIVDSYDRNNGKYGKAGLFEKPLKLLDTPTKFSEEIVKKNFEGRVLYWNEKTDDTLHVEGNCIFKYNLNDVDQNSLYVHLPSKITRLTTVTANREELKHLIDGLAKRDEVLASMDENEIPEEVKKGEATIWRICHKESGKYSLLIVQDGKPYLLTDNIRGHNIDYMQSMQHRDSWGIFANSKNEMSCFDLWLRKIGPFEDDPDEGKRRDSQLIYLNSYLQARANSTDPLSDHPYDLLEDFDDWLAQAVEAGGVSGNLNEHLER